VSDLDYSFKEKFINIGWYPGKLSEIDAELLRRANNEQILAAINTGDHQGEIISITSSRVLKGKRVENTLLGFTIGGDNSILDRELVSPLNRLSGYLVITQRGFLIIGKETRMIPFQNVFSSTGSRNSITASTYDLQKLGEIYYSYRGDIYISKIKMNKQIDLEYGYDEFTIAIVVGNQIQNPLEETWKQVERMIAL
jgi:hypothetical protein